MNGNDMLLLMYLVSIVLNCISITCLCLSKYTIFLPGFENIDRPVIILFSKVHVTFCQEAHLITNSHLTIIADSDSDSVSAISNVIMMSHSC